ncbi:nose resistant to fluoxetine protein 6-like [Amphiura filiformis]|uniref:nose resistant to fluoxetine protein 6-like n=1 Tax=Amphiura filiformis TaxID=82378 RepID=UPI003B213B08
MRMRRRSDDDDDGCGGGARGGGADDADDDGGAGIDEGSDVDGDIGNGDGGGDEDVIGMLVTYFTLNKLNKRDGQLNWALYYFHRFWRYYKIGYAVIAALMTACFTSLAVLSWKHDLSAIMTQPNFQNSTDVYGMNYIYNKPWVRINCYLVGMIAGYVLYEMSKKQWKIPKWGALLGWCYALATGVGMVYGLYGTSQGHYQTQPQAVFYQTVSRTLWSSAVAWVAFACAIGKGGPVNSILGWSAFAPLAKLAYCAYLLHPIVMNVYYMSAVTPFHAISDYNIIYLFLGNLVLSYAAAYIMSVCAEAPFMALEKLILPTRGSSSAPVITQSSERGSETSKLLKD